MTSVESASRLLETLRARPDVFAETVLGLDLWPAQVELLMALARPHARVACKAATAVGKSHAAAAALLWWVSTGGVVISTAPSTRQIRDVLWREVRQMYAAAKVPIGGELLQLELRLSESAFARGFSTDRGVRFQGYHGERILVIFDDAQGIAADIYEGREAVRAGGDVRYLDLGNPTVAGGRFYDTFTRERSAWTCVTLSAFDTPNLDGVTVDDLRAMNQVALDANARPYLQTRRTVRDRLEQWGENHPLYQAWVKGEFPSQDPRSLFPLAWLERARRPALDEGPLEAGVDVADGGEDETVAVVRSETGVVAKRSWQHAEVAPAVAAWLVAWKDRLRVVHYDRNGPGANVGTSLKALGLRADGVNAGDAAGDAKRFENRKAELYQGFRDRLERDEVAGLDESTIAQGATARWGADGVGVNARGRVVIESKADAAKRGVKSPDHLEAVIMSYATERPALRVWQV